MFYVVFQSEFVCRLRFCELRFKRLPCGGASDGQDSVHTSFQSNIFVYMYNIYIFININNIVYSSFTSLSSTSSPPISIHYLSKYIYNVHLHLHQYHQFLIANIVCSFLFVWLGEFKKNKWDPRNIINSFSIPPSVTPTTTSTASPSTHTNNENEITKNENFAKKFWQNFPLKTFPKFSPGQILCKVSISCFPSGRNSIICDSDLIKNFCQKTLAWKQQISKVSNKTLRKKEWRNNRYFQDGLIWN